MHYMLYNGILLKRVDVLIRWDQTILLKKNDLFSINLNELTFGSLYLFLWAQSKN